jgi:hypothetical protein
MLQHSLCLQYSWQNCWEVCCCIWQWCSSPELTSTNSQYFYVITGKCVGLLSEEKAFLMDAVQWGRTFCVMVTDNRQLKKVSGSSSPMSVIYHSNTALYPNTIQATWTDTSLVRTASLKAPSFKNYPYLMFNFKDPKSIIISMLSYMYLRSSST